jgi:hypothetical protein
VCDIQADRLDLVAWVLSWSTLDLAEVSPLPAKAWDAAGFAFELLTQSNRSVT